MADFRRAGTLSQAVRDDNAPLWVVKQKASVVGVEDMVSQRR
jgi:hypothetical protein